MSTRRKGTRREKQAREIYEAAGYQVYSPHNSKFGDNDLWNLFDLAAFGPMHGLYRMVQVKSNRARNVNDWMKDARFRETCVEGVLCDMVVGYDDEGWRLIRPTQTGYETAYDERKDPDVGPHRDTQKNLGEGLTEYLRNHTANTV